MNTYNIGLLKWYDTFVEGGMLDRKDFTECTPVMHSVTKMYDHIFDNYYKCAYHNFGHLLFCFDELDMYIKDNPTQEMHRFAIKLAIWFHDVVQKETTTASAEGLSAQFMSDIFGKFNLVTSPKIKNTLSFAEYIIIVGTTHMPPVRLGNFIENKVIHDIDLAHFAKDDFDHYEKKIREEYSSVPKDEYLRKRIAVLEMFVSRPVIYYTEHFRNKYEGKARANLVKTLSEYRNNACDFS